MRDRRQIHHIHVLRNDALRPAGRTEKAVVEEKTATEDDEFIKQWKKLLWQQ